ncbi:energy-coupling factor transporter transmembrane component T [Streptococcus fryi]
MSVLDVRTKVLLLCFANYLLMTRAMAFYELGFVGLLILLFVVSGKTKKGILYSILFSVLWLLDTYVVSSLSGKWVTLLSMLAVGGRLMLPCFMAGSYLLATTSVHEFMVGLRKWHFPEPLLLVLAVMFRFLPTIPEDYKHIRQSLKLRGIFIKASDVICHPMQFFEYVTVPLLMSATRTAQDLTVASLTKSISSNPRKTSYKHYQMSWRDDLLLATMGVCVIAIQFGVTRV